MKLKDYIKVLKGLEKKYGEAEMVYGIDDEGNGFEYVQFSPSVKFISKKVADRKDDIDLTEMDDNKSLDKNVPIILVN